jgi:hypothetical protein
MSAARFSAGRPAPGLRVVPVFVLAAGLAGLTACGSSGSSSTSTPATATGAAASGHPSVTTSPSASTAKLSGAAAVALAEKAITSTEAAKSVRVAGQNVGTGSGNQQVTFDLMLVKNVGCTGTIAQSAAETFKIIDTGGYVWLLPNTAFYTSLHISKQAQALLADKYIKVKSTDKQIGTLGQICTFSGLFGQQVKPTSGSYTATPTTYRGQPAYDVIQTGKSGTAIVANTTPPLLLQISDPKSGGGTITFSDYNKVATIAVPAAAESVDGTQLGI